MANFSNFRILGWDFFLIPLLVLLRCCSNWLQLLYRSGDSGIRIPIVVSFYIIYYFSLAIFKNLSLPLGFVGLTMMCLGVVFFVIIFWQGGICFWSASICFSKFYKFLTILSSKCFVVFFLPHFLSSPLELQLHIWVRITKFVNSS